MFSIRALLLPLLLGALTVTTFAQQAHVQWMSLEEAAEAQKTEPRKVMMDVYTQWCGPCKMMMANTFTNGNILLHGAAATCPKHFPWLLASRRHPRSNE